MVSVLFSLISLVCRYSFLFLILLFSSLLLIVRICCGVRGTKIA